MKYNSRKTLKIFIQHGKKYKLTFFVFVFSLAVASVANLLIPLYYKKFFDFLTSGDTGAAVRSQLLHVLFIISIYHVIQWSMWRIAQHSNNRFQPRVMADLANTCFAYLHKHSFNFFNSSFSGALVKRVTRFYRAFEGIADRVFWQLFRMFINVVVILFVLIQRSLVLGLILIVWIVLFLIFNWFLTNYKMKYDIERSEADTKATGILADTITNQSNVKLFNGYEREKSLYASALKTVQRLQTFTWDIDNAVDGLQALLMIVLEIGIFYVAIGLWQQGIFTVGDFVLIQAYIISLINHIWDFSRLIRGIYSDLADAEEMTQILETPHEIQDVKNAKTLIVTKGEIEFKKVDFYYHSTRKVMQNFDLHIKAKEKIALVGPSGAGKSTIVRLLLRMHDISRGKILIDGQKVSQVSQESLWNSVSLVPQEPILFHRSLMENIRYGRPEATDEEVREAAKKAYCHDFIEELPEKYETFVGERGVKLSGGERQRVAIARAILRNSPILVLDEATSSLDSESELFIQKALDELMRNKTVIVVAHRLSTIMKMDRIIVIEKGKVTEQGSHAQLVRRKNGEYKKLWELQVGGFLET